MPDVSALYQEVLLDHYRRPRNKGALPSATASAAGRNPLCGDEVNVAVQLDGDRIADVKFTGSGCAISQASASVMTQVVKGKTIAEAEAIFAQFHDLVTSGLRGQAADNAPTGALLAFGGVAKFPMRVKCATMSWHTLRQALGVTRAGGNDDAPTRPDGSAS